MTAGDGAPAGAGARGTGDDAGMAAGLPEWLPTQRWFGGKGRVVSSLDVAALETLVAGDPGLVLAMARVSYDDGTVERYQLLVGHRSDPPEWLEPHAWQWSEEHAVYDAAADPELVGALPRRLAEAPAAEVGSAPPRRGVRFARTGLGDVHGDLPVRGLGAEQSNTSFVVGDEHVLKVFRRPVPGLNPDLELTHALAAAGSAHVPAPLAWVDAAVEGADTTLAVLQPFLRTAIDGWNLATTSVRDLFAEGDLHAEEVGGDFASEAERLGVATAEVHEVLAQQLGSAPAASGWTDGLATAMTGRLDDACAFVEDLREHRDAVADVYSALRSAAGVQLQRVHGDYHLGQVLRLPAGWVLLDFEGEPLKSLEERAAADSPLRDVAGMLRSFDYAAHAQLVDRAGGAAAHLAYRATEWARRNSEAFCSGYAAVTGSDPREGGHLLRAYLLDKAVYEVVYEARNRPHWLPIPLGAIARLVTDEGAAHSG